MPRYQKSIFLFRRDLRLEDNTGLHQALSLSQSVIASFVFDPRQVELHPYRSLPGLQFLIESLEDLEHQLKTKGGRLYLFHGRVEETIKQLIETQQIDAIFVNRDYTPFSQQRDHRIGKICQQHGVAFHMVNDLLLIEPEDSRKADGAPYTVFTPFFKNARQHPVREPIPLLSHHFHQATVDLEKPGTYGQILPQRSKNYAIAGGRQAAQQILQNLHRFANYAQTKDTPFLLGTTRLSAHHKFGTCSVREVYHTIGQHLGVEHPLIRQLYWRDFFSQIAYHFPHVFGEAFQKKYAHVHWEHDDAKFKSWCEGNTGFPIVDAGMRELNTTGYMHNRVRMITASFLTKDLHIDWRWGERYFAQHLIDYDPCVNNGNWQWAASTGCDAQPYFRIFNPWLQQQKFDADCKYILHWIPELQGLSPKEIHALWKSPSGLTKYPLPIVDHKQEAERAKAFFKE